MMMYRSLSLSISFGEIESKRNVLSVSRKSAYRVPSVSRPNQIRWPMSSNRKTSLSRERVLGNGEKSLCRYEKGHRRHQDRFSWFEVSQVSLFPLDPVFGNQIRHLASIRAGSLTGPVPRVFV